VEIGVFWLLKMCAKLLKCATINLAEMNFYSSLEYLVVETSRKAEQLVNLYPHGDVAMRDNGN
jgi:hypothetical protein